MEIIVFIIIIWILLPFRSQRSGDNTQIRGKNGRFK